MYMCVGKSDGPSLLTCYEITFKHACPTNYTLNIIHIKLLCLLQYSPHSMNITLHNQTACIHTYTYISYITMTHILYICSY